MDNCQLILNSNGLCVICLSEVEAKLSKADLFPLHHLTSKINSSLGSVFKNVTCPWAPHAVLDRLEILADVCEGCVDLCEELLYKFQDDVGRENCVKAILEKMEKVGLDDKYKNCGSPVAVFYSGIVEKLRQDIIEKFYLKPEVEENSNESATGTPADLHKIPNLLNIPDFPISQICSYLSLEDIKSCATASKGLRCLVFPSLINSSFISFRGQVQLPAVIDYVKATSDNLKKCINLFVKCDLDEDSPGGRSALLQLFQECGRHLSHLKLASGMCGNEVVIGFRNNNPIPVLGVGNELLPNLRKFDIVCTEPNLDNSDDDYDSDDSDYVRVDPANHENQIKASLPVIKAIFGNSPNLKELKLKSNMDNGLMTPLIFKLIGESRLHIDTLETKEVHITNGGLDYLRSLHLKKLVLNGYYDLEGTRSLTSFLESQRATLRYLYLKACNTVSTLPHFEFPRMELLETYRLHANQVENVEELGPISYHTQLPKLKAIELIYIYPYDQPYFESLFPSDAKMTTTVKELNFESCWSMEENAILSFSRVFPCLSKLEIPVASYLNKLWKDLSGLEELTLRPSITEHRGKQAIWIDDIITGMKIDPALPWGNTAKNIRMYEEEYEGMEMKQSLELLTRLKLLRLRSTIFVSGPRIMLSDMGCKLVLMKMESLKCIDFCGMHSSFIGASRKVLHEMSKKMDLCFGEIRDWN